MLGETKWPEEQSFKSTLEKKEAVLFPPPEERGSMPSQGGGPGAFCADSKGGGKAVQKEGRPFPNGPADGKKKMPLTLHMNKGEKRGGRKFFFRPEKRLRKENNWIPFTSPAFMPRPGEKFVDR